MAGSIVAAGYADLDIINTIESFPERHGLATVKSISRALGGAAMNCGCDLAMLDPSLTIKPLAVIGDDEYGGYILRRLSEHKNMDLSFLLTGGSTAFTNVLDEEDTRVRTFLVYRGANALFDVDSVDPEKLGCSIFHIGYVCLLDALDMPDNEYGSRMARLLKKVRDAGILTSVDAVFDSTGRHRYLMPAAMKQADIMCVNEHEAGAAFDIPLTDEIGGLIEEAVPQVLIKMKKEGVKKWAVIHAPSCAYGIDENGDIARLESPVLPSGFIKGTVGAGDAFVSGLLIAANRGLNLPQAMEYGTAAALTSLTSPGASDGIRPIEAALELYRSLI